MTDPTDNDNLYMSARKQHRTDKYRQHPGAVVCQVCLYEVRQRTDFEENEGFPAGYRRTQQRCQKWVISSGNLTLREKSPGREAPVNHPPEPFRKEARSPMGML